MTVNAAAIPIPIQPLLNPKPSLKSKCGLRAFRKLNRGLEGDGALNARKLMFEAVVHVV